MKTNLFVEFEGRQVNVDAVVKEVKKAAKGAKTLDVYVKPEEACAYFVKDGEGSEDFKVEF